MTLTIDLTPIEQARLAEAARRTGLEPTALAKRLVTDQLPINSDSGSTGATLRELERIAAIHAARGSMAPYRGDSGRSSSGTAGRQAQRGAA